MTTSLSLNKAKGNPSKKIASGRPTFYAYSAEISEHATPAIGQPKVIQMNEISDEEFESTLTDTNRQELRKLAVWLGVEYIGPARLAPSIIARSEAELFSLSIPRFAIRRTLTDGGLVNIRRLRTFVQNAAAAGDSLWAIRDDTLTPDERDPKAIIQLPSPSLEQILLQDSAVSCLADSLIGPSRLARRRGINRLINCNPWMHSYYGEDQPSNTCPVFSPYVKSIPWGGGLCAQSVAFMATCILAKYATRVCGISEITAESLTARRELSLSELRPVEMSTYFAKAGLRMSQQQALNPDQTVDTNSFGIATRCYLASGMPIVFTTDIRRLALFPDPDRSVYAQNLAPQNPDRYQKAHYAHAVLLVGYSDESDYITFHDPSLRPYMVATLEELSSLGAFCGTDGSSEPYEHGVIMPVTPAPVRVPLLPQSPNMHAPRTPYTGGLLHHSAWFHEVWPRLEYPDLPQDDLFAARCPFILAQAKSLRTTLASGSSLPEFRRSIASLDMDAMLQRLGIETEMWLWVERHPTAIWLWDAENDSPEAIPKAILYATSDGLRLLKGGTTRKMSHTEF